MIGSGFVSQSGGGQIACGNGSKSCYGTFTGTTATDQVELTASGDDFGSWSGCDDTDIENQTCTVNLDDNDNHEVTGNLRAVAEPRELDPVGQQHERLEQRRRQRQRRRHQL